LLFESFGFFRLLRVLKNPGATVKAAPAELKTSGHVRSEEIGTGLQILVLARFLVASRYRARLPLARKTENRLI
jgi:hypothetical protein